MSEHKLCDRDTIYCMQLTMEGLRETQVRVARKQVSGQSCERAQTCDAYASLRMCGGVHKRYM